SGLSSEAERWDADVDALASPPSLLQTWAWGEVQARAGWSIERVRLERAMASVQVRGLGPVREAYVPRGPVPSTAAAVRSLADWARERGFAKLRVEPDARPDLAHELRALGFAQTKPTQPDQTSILTLRQPDELLKTFKHGRR